MNYQKLRKIKKTYFGYEEIAKVLGISLDSARVSTVRFIGYGFLLRLKRNMYVRREVWDRLNREDKFSLVNIVQVPSYISLLTALRYYEMTTQIQRDFFESVCIRRTKEVSVDGTVFNYTKLSPKLYFGFVKVKDFFIALPEKAFLDAVYLKSFGRYSFDSSSIDHGKLNRNEIKKLIKKIPKRIQEAFG